MRTTPYRTPEVPPTSPCRPGPRPGVPDSRVNVILDDDQSAGRRGPFTRQTVPQILDDLVVERLAAHRPAPRAVQLFYTAAQPAEAKNLQPGGQVPPYFLTQSRKENQFKSFAGFTGKQPQVRFGDSWFSTFDVRRRHGESK